MKFSPAAIRASQEYELKANRVQDAIGSGVLYQWELSIEALQSANRFILALLDIINGN